MPSVSVTVYVWRGDYHVAVMSVTDKQFLADLEKLFERQKVYRLTFRETRIGPEHK